MRRGVGVREREMMGRGIMGRGVMGGVRMGVGGGVVGVGVNGEGRRVREVGIGMMRGRWRGTVIKLWKETGKGMWLWAMGIDLRWCRCLRRRQGSKVC